MHRHRRGFTLVELLVVVGIIAVLIAILMPALRQARLVAQRTVCMSNQRQAYLALAMYAADFREYPCTMSRDYVTANWSSLSGGETTGFGFNTTTNGPFALLIERHYAMPAILQCSSGTDFTLSYPRRGFQPFYPVYTSDKRYFPGTWFCYNGPTAAGGLLLTYNHNNLLDRLGGAWSNWSLGPDNNTWGLSCKTSKHNNMGNPFRPGITPVGEIVLLDCISIISADGSPGNFGTEYEPHDEMPISCIPAWNQTGGALNMPVRRNVVFGDGHGVYVKRPDRNFLQNTSF